MTQTIFGKTVFGFFIFSDGSAAKMKGVEFIDLHCCPSQAPLPVFAHATHCGTHVSLLQERQDLGDIVKSEDTVGGLLESMKLESQSE